MKVEKVRLSKLVADPQNARKHDEKNIAELKRSIEELGQHRPFVVQRGTNKVIVGNGMLQAMLDLGLTEGYAYFVDDDDETSIRRALADNRIGELAGWDFNTLKDLLQDMGPEVDIPGWEQEEIERLFEPPAPLDLTGPAEGLEEVEPEDVQQCHCPKCGFIFSLKK